MSNPLISPSDCCASCPDPVVENVPGPQGAAGANGTNGTDGVNAFTSTTALFVMPAVSATVVVSVLDSTWATIGQDVFVQTAGAMRVTAKTDATHITLENLGYSGNAAPATNIPSMSTISPSGPKGADGTSGTGDMLAANNLSDVVSVPNSRNNLGLGTLAVKNTINGGDWSGTDLAVADGGTGSSTALGARTNLSAQLQDALLDAIAALVTAADELIYCTGVDAVALTTLSSFGRSLIDDASATAARSTLGSLLPRYGLLAAKSAVDANAANNDNAVTVESSRYRIDKIVVENGSINLTTGTVGVFTSAGGGGTTVAADQALSALTASTKFADLTLAAIAGTDVFTAGTLYIRTGTAQGSASTFNCWIFGWTYA